MAPGSRGVGAVFVHFSDEDSGQTGDAIGEPRVPRRSWSHYLSNAPGLADQLVASRKDSAREGGFFRSGFRLDPDKILGDPRVPRRAWNVSSFQRARARGSTCCESGRLCAQAWQRRWENSGTFSTNLISSACFHARGRRSSRCRISTILVSSESLRYLLFNGVVSSIQFLVWSTVRSNLGQTWSTLVKLGRIWSKLSKLLEMYPGLHFKGFWARWVLVGLETARSNLGQTLVNPSQTWSTLVKLGQTLGNVSRTFFLGVFDVASPVVGSGRLGSGCPRFACRHPRKSRGMSGQGSGSGGPRRSDRLAKGKAVSVLAVVLGPLVHLASLLRRRQLLLLSDRRGRDLTALLFPQDPIPEDYVAPGFRYPPQGGIRPRYPVTTPVADTPLLTNLHSHPSSSVRRCEEPPESALVRGGWSEFCQLLEIARPECLGGEVLPSHGDLSILAPARWGCSLLIGVPFWASAFGGRIPPSEPVFDFEALEILGIDDPAAIRSLLRSCDIASGLPTFIFSCFLGNDKSTIPTPIVGMFRDIDDLREYDWGALDVWVLHPGLAPLLPSTDRQFPQASGSSLSFWAFEHFATIDHSHTPMECRMTVDCIRDADIVFQPYSTFLLERPEVFRAVELSRLRIWIRSPRSLGALDGREDLAAAGWSRVAGSWVDRPWTAIFFRSSGEIERLENEILRLQLELSVSEDRHAADMDRAQEETGPCAGGADPGAGGDGADAGGLDPEPEGLGFSRCGAGCSCGDHSEIRGSASWYGHYSCYWSWLVWSWSDFFFATS
uniref:Aminotransferase-like plant mobile domain-containing protein n=1 Tax=Fagus sylvatica TaxID=28930 RepID=A0A2N9IG64_FAGSY